MIRLARPEDAADIARLITLAYRVEDFFVHGDRTNEDETRDSMRRGQFLLLEDPPGALAGCVYVEIRGDRGYFGMLSISPARQGQGLGKRLVAAAEDLCRSAGCHHMDLEIVNLREELAPFYRRLGYVAHGTAPFPDVRRAKLPCHFILMTKTLNTR